jgi:serine/threonine-protein kinase
MLAGEPPYTGATAQAVMAKILTKDPVPVTEARRAVPPPVAGALDRALQRLPADRFGTAAEFSAALEGRGPAAAAPSHRRAASSDSGRPWGWIGLAATLAVAGVWGWARPTAQVADPVPTHLAIPIPNVGGAATAQDRQLALSPDGTTLLYTAQVAPDGESDSQNRTLRRRLFDTESTVLSNVEPFLSGYVISPDGSDFVGYDRIGQLLRYGMDGGNERSLPDELVGFWSTWAEDGSVWMSSAATISGVARLLPDGQVDWSMREVSAGLTVQDVLPDGRAGLTVRAPRGVSSGPALLLDLDAGLLPEPLLPVDVVAVRYTVGHLVYVVPDGTMHAVAFDPDSRTVVGEPVRIAESVSAEAGQAQISVSRTGTVAYIPEEPRILELVSRDGRRRTVTRENRNFHNPVFSPDDRQLAVDFTTSDGRNVWTLDLANGIPTRATFERNGHDAIWTPDGRELTYIAEPATASTFGIYRGRPGSFESDSLITQVGLTFGGIWLPDGSGLVAAADGLAEESGGDIALIQNEGRGPVVPLVASPFEEAFPAVSPDGRWLAFASDRSGQYEVYVRAMDGSGEPLQVSVDGGVEAVWGNDPEELYYRTVAGGASELVAVRIATAPELSVVSREELFSMADVATATPHANFDVSNDGQTFVVVRFNPASRIMVIQNLPELVARLTGSPRD